MRRISLLMFFIVLISFSPAIGENVKTADLVPVSGPAIEIYPEGVVPDKAGPDAVCDGDWQGGIFSYLGSWYTGDEYYAVYQDPEELGCENTYPFRVTSVKWHMQNMTQGALSIMVRPILYTADLSDPLCPKPGVMIRRGGLYDVNLSSAGTWDVTFPFDFCVEGPYFVGIHCPEFIGFGQLGLIVDNGTTEPFLARSCATYNNYGGWWTDLIDDESMSNNMRLWSEGLNADESACNTCATVVQWGTDLWYSLRDGVMSYPMEDVWVTLPLPADFFGPGSDPFEGHVAYEGVPINPGAFGPADAIIRRKETASLPTLGITDTIDIQLGALNLVASSPIVVTYNGGISQELWDVQVCLSDVTQPTGRIILYRDCCYGGPFWADFDYYPKVIFTHPQLGEIVFDFGLMGSAPIFHFYTGTWSTKIHPPYFFDMPWAEFFYSPGLVAVDHDCNWGPCYIEDPCCCELKRGNANCSVEDEPDISDITRLIDYLYTSHAPLCCVDEADANASGGEPDISDITRLIDYLYLTHAPLADCP